MIVKNPEISLEDEAAVTPEEAGDFKFHHWAFVFTAYGDDGKQYWIDCNVLSQGAKGTWAKMPSAAMDMWALAVRSERGKVVQSTNSVYKIADFPQTDTITFHPYPLGSLTINRSEHEVAVDLEDFHVICKDDKTWHASVDDKERDIKAEFVHTIVGFPLWYGREEPCPFSPNSKSYGYGGPGTVEGTLTIGGRKVRIKGKGVRERCWIVAQSMAEVGAWNDWIWFHFDEMSGMVNEMKFSKHKDMSLYLIDEKKYFPTGSFNIEHHDWAYLRPLGAFIPTRYKVTVETEAGVLEMIISVIGANIWAATGDVPDVPTFTLDFDNIDGTFIYKDGRKRKLTNGLGGTTGQLWKSYPDIFSPEIAGEGMPPAIVIPTTA